LKITHPRAEQPAAENLYSLLPPQRGGWGGVTKNHFSALPRKKRAYSTGGFAQLGGDAHNFTVRADEAPIAQSRWRKEREIFSLYF